MAQDAHYKGSFLPVPHWLGQAVKCSIRSSPGRRFRAYPVQYGIQGGLYGNSTQES